MEAKDREKWRVFTYDIKNKLLLKYDESDITDMMIDHKRYI